MSLLMMMMGFGGQQLVTETFTSNATWVAPSTTSSILTMSGKGSDGTPGGSTTTTNRVHRSRDYKYRRSDGGITVVYDVYSTWTDPKPTDTHTYITYSVAQNPTYSAEEYWEEYYTTTSTTTYPATDGVATTGWGKTFPGGSGGPAPTTNFTNVAITPGQSYSIVVPSGGSVTISYYK